MINDDGYFAQYPAPIFEASCKDHIDTVINHSTPYYGPLLYWLVRSCGATYVAEVGVCKGWASYFMASGVKDNMTRWAVGENGQYYGIDTSGYTKELQEMMREKGLPVTMIQKDSYDLVPEDFKNDKFGLVFIDGWHSRQHLLKEVDFFYPKIHDTGRGYMVIHDCYGWVLEATLEVINNPKYKWEHIRFFDNCGLAILRRMDNYEERTQANTWKEGPQDDIRPKDEFGGVDGLEDTVSE